ncbi:MarR family winged helix-turn-helix transcriptional regulator [Methylobacterium pseudosasicola]|nr:MarR family transcriptional regulator [Methylobacterium pseudosasicola]
MVANPQTLSDIFATETLGSPENAVGFVLWRVVHRYVREIDRILAPVGLTHLQFTVLAMAGWLLREGEAVTQVTLARFGDIHPMQVSQVLKALEAKGLIARPRSAADTRAKSVAVTEAGVDALRRAMPLAIAVQARLFGQAGRPGGKFLDMMLRFDRPASD